MALAVVVVMAVMVLLRMRERVEMLQLAAAAICLSGILVRSSSRRINSRMSIVCPLFWGWL